VLYRSVCTSRRRCTGSQLARVQYLRRRGGNAGVATLRFIAVHVYSYSGVQSRVRAHANAMLQPLHTAGFDSTASPLSQHMSFMRARLLLLHVCSSSRFVASNDVASRRSTGMRSSGRSASSLMGRESAGSLAEAFDVSMCPIKTREKSEVLKGQAELGFMESSTSYLAGCDAKTQKISTDTIWGLRTS
jgi:hypothetical protein